MTAPYIDDTGIHLNGLNNWLAELQAGYQGIFGSDISIGTDDADGQWLGQLAGILADVEQLAETVYLGRSRAGAVGAGLSRLMQLIGILRNGAQFSSAPITLTGTPGTVIPAGSKLGSATDSTKPPFQTSGTSPANDLTIGGGGTVTGTAICTVAGPVTAIAGELTVLLTSVTGWTGVTNTSDVTPGKQVEADPAARTRMAASVALPAQSRTDALYAALANLSGVSNARVYENRTAATDSKNLPAHSINAVVRGGVAADIANAMWVKAGQGCTLVGAQSLAVTDGQGNPQLMQWDIASDVDIYIIIKLDRNPTNLGYIQAQFAAAIVAFYSPTGLLPADIGDNIAWADILTPVNALALTGRKGLPSISQVLLGSAPGPVLQADQFVAYNSIAVFDVSRIQVTGP